jgi:hypothetical protein
MGLNDRRSRQLEAHHLQTHSTPRNLKEYNAFRHLLKPPRPHPSALTYAKKPALVRRIWGG